MLRAIASTSSGSSGSGLAAPRMALASVGLSLSNVPRRSLIVARPCLLLPGRSSAAGPSEPLRYNSSSSAASSPDVPTVSPSTPGAASSSVPPSPPPPPKLSSSSSSSSSSGRGKKALGAVLWLPVIYFVMQHMVGLGQLHGESMSPTINPPSADGSPSRTSDLVLLDRFVGSTYAFRVGDIVTLRSPSDPDQLLTKRILAMEGDTVTVRLPLETTHAFPGAKNVPKRAAQGTNASGLERQGEEEENDETSVALLRLRVPPGHVWVEGDASVAEEATWEAQRSLHRSMKSRGAKPSPHLSGPTGRTRSRDSREFGPVPIGLLEARVSFVLWPLAHFGRPGPRPGFDAEGMRERRELRESRVRRYVGEGLAHPGDSSISPYLDWDDGKPEGEEEETQVGSPSTMRFTTQDGEEGTAKEHWEKVEELWRSHLNTLSRGGSLGDHAGRDEV